MLIKLYVGKVYQYEMIYINTKKTNEPFII